MSGVFGVGIDPSTFTGLAAVGSASGPWEQTRLVRVETCRGLRRVQLIAQQVEDWVRGLPPNGTICIEGYGYGNRFTIVGLVEIGTAIRLALLRMGIRWYDVPPTVLKAFATGKGNSKKPMVAAAVAERWGFTSKSDDVVDAYVLARMAEHIAIVGSVPTNWKGVRHEDR